MSERPKVVVVFPAYYAEKTLERTVREVPLDVVDEMLLVDDGSRDRTVEIAESLGLTVFRHERNRGYGANQKTCYRQALARGAQIIVMIHPDYQYDPRLLRYLVGYIAEGYFDVMLGTRIRSRQESLAGGMPWWKYFGNRLLTLWENLVSGLNLSEWHTGMRAYRREVLEAIDFEANSDGFLFDSQILFQIIDKGFRIGEIPVPVRYFHEASSISFKESLKYGIGTVGVATAFLLRRLFRR